MPGLGGAMEQTQEIGYNKGGGTMQGGGCVYIGPPLLYFGRRGENQNSLTTRRY